MPHFVQDVEELRQRAMKKIDEGPITSTYGVDKDKAVEILNEALATEIVCVLRYMHHYFMATGVHGRAAADEFKEHADEEREHADRIGERIQQLGGKPDFNPRTLMERSVAQYVEGESLADMIREDLIAERIVIDVYREMIKFFGSSDPTTRVLIENILEDEEEHANDLADLLYVVNPATGETEMQDPGTEIGKGNGEARMNPSSQRQSQAARQKSKDALREENEQARERADQQAGETRRALQNIKDRQDREGGQRQARATQIGGRESQEKKAPASERDGRQDRGEARPARSSGQQRPAASHREIPPAHAPGTTGRVMARRGRNDIAPAEDDIALGGQSGSRRSPKVVQKNRKNRAA